MKISILLVLFLLISCGGKDEIVQTIKTDNDINVIDTSYKSSSVSSSSSSSFIDTSSTFGKNKVTNLSASILNNKVQLTWDAITGAETYNVFYQLGSNIDVSSANFKIEGIEHSSLDSAKEGLIPNETYSFVVFAQNSVGDSSQLSDPVSIKYVVSQEVVDTIKPKELQFNMLDLESFSDTVKTMWFKIPVVSDSSYLIKYNSYSVTDVSFSAYRDGYEKSNLIPSLSKNLSDNSGGDEINFTSTFSGDLFIKLETPNTGSFSIKIEN